LVQRFPHLRTKVYRALPDLPDIFEGGIELCTIDLP
jgi:hypothetical protein